MKMINEANKELLFSLTPDDITKTKLFELFANKEKTPPIFPIGEFQITIPKGHWGGIIDKDIITTPQRYIFNLFNLLPTNFILYCGFINEPVNGKVIDRIETAASDALINKKISVENFIDYLDRTQWFSNTIVDFVTPGINMDFIKPNKKVQQQKEVLFKKYSKELASGDVITATAIENELCSLAENELKDNDAINLYKAGGKPTFGNNFKNASIMKGASLDNATGKYNIVKSNYTDGIKKEEFPMIADSMVLASYSRAINTQEGGYLAKQMYAAFQSVKLDKPGSNCGTKQTIRVKITPSNSYLFKYRYISVGEKLVYLDAETLNKYVGKTVNLRSPMLCLSPNLCSKCAGELYYKLGIEAIGPTCGRAANSILNMALKKFHDTSVKTTTIDFENSIT